MYSQPSSENSMEESNGVLLLKGILFIKYFRSYTKFLALSYYMLGEKTAEPASSRRLDEMIS